MYWFCKITPNDKKPAWKLTFLYSLLFTISLKTQISELSRNSNVFSRLITLVCRKERKMKHDEMVKIGNVVGARIRKVCYLCVIIGRVDFWAGGLIWLIAARPRVARAAQSCGCYEAAREEN